MKTALSFIKQYQTALSRYPDLEDLFLGSDTQTSELKGMVFHLERVAGRFKFIRSPLESGDCAKRKKAGKVAACRRHDSLGQVLLHGGLYVKA